MNLLDLIKSPAVSKHMIGIQAEKKFKQAVAGICVALTPEHLEDMASNKMSIASVLSSLGWEIPKAKGEMAKAGVEYLLSRTDQQLFALVEDAVPEHALVLRQHPDFTRGFIRDLRRLAMASVQ